MRAREEALRLADEVLAAAPVGAAEIVVVENDAALTRYAANAIHQNVAESSTTLRLRLVHEDRTGVAEVRGGPADGASAGETVARLVAAAERARRLAPPSSSPVALAAPDGGEDAPVAYSEATVAADPELRADLVGRVCAAARARGLEAYGALDTETTRRTVVTTTGIRRSACSTRSELVAVVRGADGSGYAGRAAAAVDGLDVDAAAAEAVSTCERNQGAEPVGAGDYEVVMTPYAVATLVAELARMGGGALARQEGRSFMRPGERLLHESVTIADDAAHPDGLPFPFDWEGVSARRVVLVERGVCRDVVYDTPTAQVDGVRSTGHGLPMPNTQGPWASHLAMDAGDRGAEELVAGVRRGLYVTRLWYVRQVHELRTIITGMTREGTFLIEDGRIGRPVRDLRFTQSIVEALATTAGIGAERVLVVEDGVAVVVPAVHMGRFAFTS